ncbi:hypothetical protein A6A19_00365 [Actinobacillus delphinicola]|uniref:EexN family lipoprotein n=1 Tax=Actinobacillus delphinicola TaxID=51161 RepID=UPI0024434240|nr:EexN family lipoprotein [Actinobacillus delphinicola]MDG6896499.1 hypothetical protein [Actinobacillus delphinicola]
MKKIIFVLASVLVLSACGEKNYTVDELVKDPQLLKKIDAKCRNGELDRNGQTCDNATHAHLRLSVNEYKKTAHANPW